MIALLQRNIKTYFANIPGVIMSCLGALISFFIYVGFLEKNLKESWAAVPHVTKVLDLWIIAGIVAVAGITTSFQALGQLVKDRESRTADDLLLTDTPVALQNFAYILSSGLVSVLMQLVVLAVMAAYFMVVDQVRISPGSLLPMGGFIILGAVAATLLNAVMILFIHSATTFSRLSAVIGAAAGFAVATYMPYGSLTAHGQTLVKLFPSSYEAAAVRNLLLQGQLPSNEQSQLLTYLGAQFKIHGDQLTRIANAYLLFGMILALTIIVVAVSLVTDRKRHC